MTNLDSLSQRALALAEQVGDNLQHAIPTASKWLETGVKLGALKTTARVAGTIVRRNPAIAIATAAGAGLLWYAARRKAKQAQNGPIDSSSKRVEARRVSPASAARKKTTKTSARKRARAAETASTSD
ncbi:MAG: hypothetical protein M3Q40_04270 [Pseudomonadota bacterium]|nr:hypothetical protein [Pseudomonadota bacterium]